MFAPRSGGRACRGLRRGCSRRRREGDARAVGGGLRGRLDDQDGLTPVGGAFEAEFCLATVGLGELFVIGDRLVVLLRLVPVTAVFRDGGKPEPGSDDGGRLVRVLVQHAVVRFFGAGVELFLRQLHPQRRLRRRARDLRQRRQRPIQIPACKKDLGQHLRLVAQSGGLFQRGGRLGRPPSAEAGGLARRGVE